jgi:alkanesulfonate monooxygenase SsuD/methylene tetrahydromethanopterin reductase-like flavin-dependent oxidoreductase (luciferase family)
MPEAPRQMHLNLFIQGIGHRYARATEFVEVAMKLWDSWDDAAFIADRARGRFVDRSRIRRIDHDGEHFKVRGPMDFPGPPQGYPVLVQAGSSEDGREFAGRFAEAIYTAQNNLADAQAFYTDVKARMRRHGRTPDQLCILPGVLRTGAAGTAAARAVSNRVHRPHPARPFRAAASRR